MKIIKSQYRRRKAILLATDAVTWSPRFPFVFLVWRERKQNKGTRVSFSRNRRESIAGGDRISSVRPVAGRSRCHGSVTVDGQLVVFRWRGLSCTRRWLDWSASSELEFGRIFLWHPGTQTAAASHSPRNNPSLFARRKYLFLYRFFK